MPRTDAQAAASRTNGSLSIGPISPIGKLNASRNSTKHGLSGSGKCLPPEMAVALPAEIAMFTDRHHPRDDYEHDLIRKAALGNLRSRRLSESQNALIDLQTREAEQRWDETRADEVAALMASLDDDPEATLRQLRRTAEGCDALGDAWDTLADLLKAEGHWDEARSRRALRLLGMAETPNARSPEPLLTFWRCVLSLRFERDPDALMRSTFRSWSGPEAVRRYLPDPAEARGALAEFVRKQHAELVALGASLWEDYGKPARQSAAARAAFDTSPEAARLERYIKDAERMRDKALNELIQHRRDEARALASTPASAPARNEPEPPARNEPEPAPRNEPEAPEPSPELAALERFMSYAPPCNPVVAPGLDTNPPTPEPDDSRPPTTRDAS